MTRAFLGLVVKLAELALLIAGATLGMVALAALGLALMRLVGL